MYSSALTSGSLSWEVERGILILGCWSMLVSTAGRKHSSADGDCSGAGGPVLQLGSACWTLLHLAHPSHSGGWPQRWALRLRSLTSLPYYNLLASQFAVNPASGLQGQMVGKLYFFLYFVNPSCFFPEMAIMSVEVILLSSPSFKWLMKARRIWLNRKHQQTAVDDRKN